MALAGCFIVILELFALVAGKCEWAIREGLLVTTDVARDRFLIPLWDAALDEGGDNVVRDVVKGEKESSPASERAWRGKRDEGYAG